MNILHIIPNLRKGGAERLVIDIVRELKNRKDYSIQLVIFRDEIEYEIEDIIDVLKIIPAAVQLSLLRKNKYHVSKLQELLENYQPDIIHTHLFEAEIVSRSCYYPKAKWFSHCHDNMFQLKNFHLSTLYKKSLFANYYEKQYLLKRYEKNSATRFIAISQNAENYFKHTVAQYPITLLYNAINFERFFKQKETLRDENPTIKIVNTGSFVPKKNQQFLLKIAQNLKAKKISFEIHFLGDGPLRKQLEEKAESMQLKKEVFFHGNVHNVEEYLWQSDIYIHTANYEPLGLVLIEAMAAGLPVICLDGGGNRDLIEEGKNGYMIYEQNPNLFADKIVQLCTDKNLYEYISSNGQNFAQNFDVKNYVSVLLEVYKNATKNAC